MQIMMINLSCTEMKFSYFDGPAWLVTGAPWKVMTRNALI